MISNGSVRGLKANHKRNTSSLIPKNPSVASISSEAIAVMAQTAASSTPGRNRKEILPDLLRLPGLQ